MSIQNSNHNLNSRTVLERFVDSLNNRLSAKDLEAVLQGQKDDLTSQDLGNKPEAYTENNLIEPLLEAVELEYEPQPYGKSGERDLWPDFEITNLDTTVIGESKPVNNVDKAQSEIKNYLDRKSLGADYGIATDGVEWYVYKIELGGDFTEYSETGSVDLRDALLTIAQNKNYIGSTSLEEVNLDEELTKFTNLFGHDTFNELLSQTAPRVFRDARKRDIEEFYELYIELLFGVSDEYDYDTNLMDDIQSPYGASEHDKRLFAITLMNRLLFIKFLETRGVLYEGFLKERVLHYEENAENLAGNLYETQIEPLFYKLFNTPEEKRDPKYQGDDKWFSDVPYLNGGLFRENIPNERHYTVNDRVLPNVIRDLIEGSRLELNGRGFDPAILGSVFEKTINHIEQERTQKDIGAYYTPNDVTELIIEQSVDPKIRDILVEAVVDETATTANEYETIRRNLKDLDLTEMLRRVEEGEGWFGNANAIMSALQELRELKVIDPACGSGHFLTSAMDEIHRAQVTLLRGLNFGEDPDPIERYQEKQKLALNCIYGVDVDPIASEIAKLRIWLKIVEGNGWEPSFGKLPNIDVNITDGNSLIGLPMTGSFDDVDIWSEGIQEIEQRRQEYKQIDEGDPREMERFMDEEIRPKLNQKYVEIYSKPVETEITSVKEFDAICEAIDGATLYPALQMVRVKRDDSEAFDADRDEPGQEEEMLEARGFSVYTKSAKIDIQDRESVLKRRDDIDDHRTCLQDELRELLDGPYIFSEVQRQPLEYDLERVLGTPFHWMAEFPEVVTENNGRHEIDFDLVLGNPPYGDLLNAHEKIFISTYNTDSYNEISANFVERQLQLLNEDGYFGNVTTLRLVYQSTLHELHELIRQRMGETRIACFAKRPSHIFDNAQVRIAIITGQQEDRRGEIWTSEFIRFDKEDREQRISNVSYRPAKGFILGDKIGEGDEDYAILPKIGNKTIESILETLKERSDTVFRDQIDRKNEKEYAVWRMYHPDNWMNPMLEKMWDARDLNPIYFETQLERDSTFLIMSSSLFYLYWMVYGNQRDLNWGQVEAFPYPEIEELKEHEEEITNLASRLWQGMLTTFESEPKPHYENMSGLKPLIDQADEIFGEIIGLSEEEIEYIKQYDADYGRSTSDSKKLREYTKGHRKRTESN